MKKSSSLKKVITLICLAVFAAAIGFFSRGVFSQNKNSNNSSSSEQQISTSTVSTSTTSSTTPNISTTTSAKPATSSVAIISQKPKPVAVATSTHPTETSTKPVASSTKPNQNVTTSTLAQQPVESFDPNDLNQYVRKATVNILCLTGEKSPLNSITGSGVMIDSRGVVLTNAHIAQYFLLKDYPQPNSITCTIRTGSPARSKYLAELLYLPKTWVDVNAQNIVAQNPVGTGEGDFALLRITGSADSFALPSSFFSVDYELTKPSFVGDEVIAAAYPAGLLAGSEIVSNLYAVSSIDTVEQTFSFSDPSNVDLISLGGNVLAQRGSSGGAILRQSSKKLLGIVVTATQGQTTDQSVLRAITLSHISEVLQKNVGANLKDFLDGDIVSKARQFQKFVEPELGQKLIQEIEG